ncbi:MAG: helix-turn-helix transcriptional regulator [Betaproteobacteria bacterium]|jgi:DNA-binding transcriptional ArsR family regulator|nr:helix-turn-helix transcriptional regulator [Betaproteobacteria bacterium]
MQNKEAVAALAALAHASRLAVFRHLVEAGPAGDTPGRIAGRLSIPASTLSFHLKELSHAGLVASRSSSRFLVYSVDFARMADLMAFLTRSCCHGMPEACFATVETALSRHR